VEQRRPPDLVRRRLLVRCRDAHARVVRLVARPGWGKTTFARQLAAVYGEFAVVECGAAMSAADLEAALANAVARDPACVVIDSAECLVGSPDALARLPELLDEQRAGLRIVIASRVELSVGVGRGISPHEVLTLRATDLAFDAAEIREVFAASGVAEAVLQRVIQVSLGWPIAVFLFARLAREGQLDTALADLSHPLLDDLFEYVDRETRLAMTPEERLGLAAVAAIPNATPEEIEDAVGEAPRRALETFEVRTGMQIMVDGRFAVPELHAAGARRLVPAEMNTARDAAIRRAVASGAHLRAAQIRFANGDYDGAVAEMEALGVPPADPAPSPSYTALAKALPLPALLRSRNVLVSVLAERETQANPYPLWHAVERFSPTLQRDSEPELVAGNRAAYAVLLRLVERPREARVVLEKALALGDPSPERTALLTANLAAVHAVAGEVDAAESLLARAGVPPSGPTLFPCERFEVEIARHRLRGDPARRRAAFERNVDEARFAGPAAHGYALRLLAASAWLDGDDAAAVAAMETRNREVEPQPWERRRVGTGRPSLDVPLQRLDRWTCVWYVSTALLEDDADTARRFAQVALDGLAEIGAPLLDAVAALVAATLPGDDAPALIARARADAVAIGEPAFTAAVEAIVEERYGDAGILLPLARRIERSRGIRVSSTHVYLLEGRVLNGAEPLALRERELELIVALALERRPLTREALVSRLWPDVAPDEANAALRTAVYRLRKQLRDPAAVVSTAAGYRLAESIPVDLLEAEQFVAGARGLGALSDRERARLTALLERLSDGLPTVYARWDWFVPYEQRARDLLHDAGIALAEDDLRRGDTAAALARAETLLRADALDEPANEVAIRAHVAAGRKSEALRRYRRYRDALQREYGFAPDAKLGALLGISE
jgi:SARP family transcriptional regulator, regulator of embCAB operon